MSMGENSIIWKNIFYFLGYCENFMEYLRDDAIDYENVKGLYDLLATILNISFDTVVKFGYNKQYEEHEVSTNKPRGKIDVAKSYKTGAAIKGKMVCHISELTIDTQANQIIKLAFELLMKVSNRLNKETLKKVVNNYRRLSKVSSINLSQYSKDKQIKIPRYYDKAITISKFIINDWILLDEHGVNRLYTLDDESRAKYIWEEFLRKFIKEYVSSVDSEYIVEKRSFKFDNGGSIIPDIVVYKNTDSAPLRIFDAKWYTDPKMISSIKYELHAQATKVGSQIKNSDTNVIAVFGYHKKYRNHCKTSLKSDIFKYNMWDYTINVNQDFESIKIDIQDMINEQLGIVTTT